MVNKFKNLVTGEVTIYGPVIEGWKVRGEAYRELDENDETPVGFPTEKLKSESMTPKYFLLKQEEKQNE